MKAIALKVPDYLDNDDICFAGDPADAVDHFIGNIELKDGLLEVYEMKFSMFCGNLSMRKVRRVDGDVAMLHVVLLKVACCFLW